jgi:DNA-binding NarL/FixJ family response regulator
VKVLVLSMYDEEEIVSSSLAAGASGYIQKDAQFSELIRAIDVVQKGGTYLFPGFFRKSSAGKDKEGRLRGRHPTKRRTA